MNNTIERAVQYAFRDAGLVPEGQLPNSDQLQDGLARANDLVALWVTQGIALFLQEDIAVPIVAGKATYILGPTGDVVINRPLQCLQAYYLDTNGVRRPLVALSRDEYTRLPQTTQQAQINSYFIDRQASYMAVSFWNTPDSVAATGTCHLILRTAPAQMVTLTAALTLPPEWFLALRWGLADDLATGQPEEIVQRCAQRSQAFRDALTNFDVENAVTYFSPDTRMSPVYGRQFP